MLAATANWFPIVDEREASRELVDGILENRFTFCAETIALSDGFCWTENPSKDVEWHILLHKFYYAAGMGRAWQQTGRPQYLYKWLELTSAWMDQTPVDFMPADVAGRRIQNWVSAWYYFAGAPMPSAFRLRLLASIEEQANWLSEHLTPARNHRTLELLALFYAAVAFPEMESAPRWLGIARQGIVDNLQADLRPDGVHCEQSTDYHHIVLRNALFIRRLAVMNGIPMPDGLDRLLRGALDFSVHAHRPDGLIPALSDGDTGSYLGLLQEAYELFGDPSYLWVASQGRQGRPPAERLKAFPDGGYYFLRSGWGLDEPYKDERYLVFDCGPLGEGNHGHLDLLSFELYGYGRPLIVDPGRFTYDESGDVNWRVHFRSTAAHNTVCVDGRNQTRYEFHKRKFKVRGPQPAYALLGFGSRDGYDFVRGRIESQEYDVVHEREIRMAGGTRFVIIDELTSANVHSYAQCFQVAPGAEQHVRLIDCTSGAACVTELGWVSAVYGEKQAAPRIRFVKTGTSVRFETLLEVLA